MFITWLECIVLYCIHHHSVLKAYMAFHAIAIQIEFNTQSYHMMMFWGQEQLDKETS